MNMHVLLVPCTHKCVKVQCAMVLMHYGVLQHARNNSDMAMVPPMSLSPGSSDSFPMPPVSAFQGFPPPKPTSPEQPSADAGIPPKPASGSRYALPFRSENSTRHSAHTVSLSEVATWGTRRPGFFPLLPMSAFQRIPPPRPTSPEQPFTDADIPPKPASGPEFVHQPIILPFIHFPSSFSVRPRRSLQKHEVNVDPSHLGLRSAAMLSCFASCSCTACSNGKCN